MDETKAFSDLNEFEGKMLRAISKINLLRTIFESLLYCVHTFLLNENCLPYKKDSCFRKDKELKVIFYRYFPLKIECSLAILNNYILIFS